MTGSLAKIVSRKRAVLWRNAQKRLGRRVVFTNGCFDILHAGHITLLEKARRFGDALAVGLNSDGSVKRLKGPGRPVNPQNDRARVLAALSAVDRVVIFDEDTPYELLKLLKPDTLVKGADYSSAQIVGREFAARVARVPVLRGRSTSLILAKSAKKCR